MDHLGAYFRGATDMIQQHSILPSSCHLSLSHGPRDLLVGAKGHYEGPQCGGSVKIINYLHTASASTKSKHPVLTDNSDRFDALANVAGSSRLERHGGSTH
ncbi:inositol monophosphatase [Anopheles sinensis]|uniref:Inositol monophosphatase n=1 Tax=Anopheles sinensis TaxID=74873 RepID=A0A084VYT3_ANOSI|nr:inositol monophosphatase [Anopheles sinensis]